MSGETIAALRSLDVAARASTAPTNPTGPQFAAEVKGTIRACVEADGRTQAEIASAAWPGSLPGSALQRLYRTLAGAWPSAETAADLARALGVEPVVFFAGDTRTEAAT